MIPRTSILGPQNRVKKGICTEIFQNVQSYPAGTNQIGQVFKGKYGKRLYTTITIAYVGLHTVTVMAGDR